MEAFPGLNVQWSCREVPAPWRDIFIAMHNKVKNFVRRTINGICDKGRGAGKGFLKRLETPAI
jgi:hypothetical protein